MEFPNFPSLSGPHSKSASVAGVVAVVPTLTPVAEEVEVPRRRSILDLTGPHPLASGFQKRAHVAGPLLLLVQSFKLIHRRHPPPPPGGPS